MRKRFVIAAALVLGVIAAMLGANTARNAAGWQPVTQTPAERLALLAPGWRLIQPEGAGPFRAAILMSGCDGVHDNMDLWARRMVALGRAALIVDSHGPRGLDRMQSWRAVCAAQLLTGAERAGDIAVAQAALAAMPQIDPRDMLLLGASHGGWSVMEYLDLLDSGALPPGLGQWPMTAERLAAGIGPVVLLYPYCGVISRAGDAEWPAHVRALMILSSEDRIVDPEKCETMAQGLVRDGADLRLAVLQGADHGFDQREHSVLSSLDYVQEYVDQAAAMIDDFLRGEEGAAADR